jgi:hypothetical protein
VHNRLVAYALAQAVIDWCCTTVVSQAAGVSSSSCAAPCHLRKQSCTMSSASALLPTMRRLIAVRRGRNCSNRAPSVSGVHGIVDLPLR